MKKYTESVIINIIEKIEAISKNDIVKLLLMENIDLTVKQLDDFLQHLIDKKYIYRHNNKESHSIYDTLYSNSCYYFKHVCSELNNLVLRTSTKPLKLYDNVNIFSQLYIITIETRAPLTRDNFKNIDILEFKESVDRYKRHTYTLIGVIKYNNSLIIEPDLDYINKITNGNVNNKHFYYSLRVTIKEFIVHKFIITDNNKSVKVRIRNLRNVEDTDYLYCVYFNKDNCNEYEFIDCSSIRHSRYNSILEVVYSKEKGELLFLIHPSSIVVLHDDGYFSIHS